MSEEDKKNSGIDLEEFIEFYLLDSQEQIDKLGAGLLQLEREGENISLINDLFRSAHSLKGASGTMGFTPIVELTHAAEDLLDKLRQGKLNVTNDIIDVLLAVTDQVKLMLAQVEQRVEISADYGNLISQMKSLAETGVLTERVSAEGVSAPEPPADQPQGEKEREVEKHQFDFPLTSSEIETLQEALFSDKSVYQIEVLLSPDALMKAVRAVMVIQRLEPLGKIVKLHPTIEELEANDYQKFNLLFITTEPLEEIRVDILEVSEILDARITPYFLEETAFAETAAATAQAAAPVSAPELISSPAPALEPQAETVPTNATVSASTTAPAPAAGQETAGNQVHTIRVDTARMDNLINLVGEMVITRTRLVKIAEDLKASNQSNPLVHNLIDTNVYLGRLMNDLQESVMRLRMVPIGTVFSRFPRLVRDFCRKTGKKIELVIKGEETELDKTVIEMIGDPLTHIIRNSVDHGIETPEKRLEAGKAEIGTITLDAYQEGNHITIIVSDDGSGLDLEKIYNKALERGLISDREELSDRDIANFIFLPGFSTADQITDISGRGVGMDVVKKALNSLGGLVDIKTVKGKGTSFIIHLPLTLAIIQALLVEVAQEIYAVPLSSVVETLLIKSREIKTVGGLSMVQLRGNTLPLISLRAKFALPDSAEKPEEVFVVVVGLGDKTLGLIVDELHGQQEIVIKSLGDYLNGLPGIAGATILGDGKVTLILDIGSLIQDILINR